MNQNHTISIIVPVYNTKEYLPRCVNSLIGQNYAEKEIILVNDGSTDESGELCDIYSRDYNCVKVIHKENGGLTSAWMAGVEASVGEYLCFVDSDDWVETDMLQEMAKYLIGSAKEIIACNFSIDRENGERELRDNTLVPGAYNREMLEKEVFTQLLGNEIRRVSFSRCMKLIARELILQNMKYCNPKIKMGEDVNIMLPSLLDAERLVIMEGAYFYHYYYNQNSIVHSYDTGLYKNVKLLRQIIDEILIKKSRDNLELSKMRQRADMEYIFFLMLVLKNEVRGNRAEGRKNIKEICKEKEAELVIKNTPVMIRNNANRLLYTVMKHPNWLTISLLKLAMIVYYR